MEIRLIGHDLENSSIIRRVVAEFYERIGRPINVSNHHGSRYNPEVKIDELYIFFWSTPSRAERTRFIFPVFGKNLQGGAIDAFQPSNNPECLPLLCPEGKVIAEVPKDNPNCLYILFDLPHDARENVEKNLRGILELYCSQSRFNTRKRQIAKLISEIVEIETASKIKANRTEKISKSLDRIRHDADNTIFSDEKIKITLNSGEQILINIDNGSYQVIISGDKVPFHDICPGPAKAGLAVCLGRHQYYEAFKIIENWTRHLQKKAGK